MKNKLAFSSLILIALTLFSKLLVIVRDMAMASVFGASTTSDAYVTAVSILSMISMSALASLIVSYIPIISGKEDREVSYITSNFISVMSMLTLILSIAALFVAEPLVKLFASGFDKETTAKCAHILKIVLPLLFANVILNISVAYLQHKNKFWYQGFSAVIANAVIIFSVLSSGGKLTALAVGYLLSIVIPAGLGLIIAVKAGFRPQPVFKLNDKHLRELILLSIPIFLSQILIELNVIVDKNFASYLEAGIMTDLDYANKITNLLVTSFITPIATVLFPTLANAAANDNTLEYKNTLGGGIRASSLIMVPLTVGIILLAQPLVEVFFMRGEFTQTAADITANSLVIYAAAMIPLGYLYIMNNAFFSVKDTKTPLICGTIPMLLKIALNFALVPVWGYKGLAASTAITTNLNAAIYFVMLRRKIGPFGFRNIAAHFCKTLFAAAVMGAAVFFLRTPLLKWAGSSLSQKFLVCLIIAAIGAGIYYAVCSALKLPEAQTVNGKVKNLINKLKRK